MFLFASPSFITGLLEVIHIGIKTLEMSASEITINEANYDGNLEIGQSRTFYEPVKEELKLQVENY